MLRNVRIRLPTLTEHRARHEGNPQDLTTAQTQHLIQEHVKLELHFVNLASNSSLYKMTGVQHKVQTAYRSYPLRVLQSFLFRFNQYLTLQGGNYGAKCCATYLYLK